MIDIELQGDAHGGHFSNGILDRPAIYCVD